MSVVDRFQQAEYTGENRCTPCTTVNLLIAIVVSVLLAIVSPVGGITVFVLSVGTIYLRGYLVPGTPTLTKRYFPERVLRWFDKNTSATASLSQDGIDIDPERVLLDAGAVEPCRKDTDLCLTDAFQTAWRENVATAREYDLGADHLAGALALPLQTDEITIEQPDGAFVAYTDDAVIGQWESTAAVIADVAAASELSERVSNWSSLAPAEIARVLMSLRIFLEQCPDCDGPVRVEQEVVESCCRSYDVIAPGCQNCDARLFEIEWDETRVDEQQATSDRSSPRTGQSPQ